MLSPLRPGAKQVCLLSLLLSISLDMLASAIREVLLFGTFWRRKFFSEYFHIS